MQIYPILNPGVIIKPVEKKIIISRKQQEITVSDDFMPILKLCNGMNSIEKIVDFMYSKNTNSEELIVNWGMLLQNGIIDLHQLGEKKTTIIYPRALHIELTHKCNLRCFYCYQNSSPETKSNFISTKQLFKKLLELKKKGLSTIEITGGEPLLHPEFVSIFKFCAENFQLVSLLTNGILVDNYLIELMKPYINKVIVNVSLDSYIAEKQDKIAGMKGSFKKISNAIRLFGKNGFLIRVATVITEDTWDSIEQIILTAQKLGAKKFTFSTIIPEGRGKKAFNRWSQDINKVWAKEKAIITKYKDFLHINELEDYKTKDSLNCGAGHRAFALAPNGNIRACESTPNNYFIGNIFNQSVKEVFSNPAISKFLILPNPCEETCSPCKYTLFCKGCFFRAKTVITDEPDFNCKWKSLPIVKEWIKAVN